MTLRPTPHALNPLSGTLPFGPLIGVVIGMPRNPDGRKCSAHISSGLHKGRPCDKWAIRGATVCGSHGGSSPRVRAAAAVNEAEKSIAVTLGRLQITPVDNPLTALAELAGEILAWKRLAAEKVAELRTLETWNPETGEAVRASVIVFERAMDRAVTVLATIARLKIDERLAAITAEQADAVVEMLMGALADAGLDGTVQREVTGHAFRRLRLVAG